MSLLSDKAGEDGVYSVTYDEDSKFCILQTNYTEYIIFYLMNVNNNGSSAGTLRPRTRRESKIKKKFVKICQKYGIVKENIFPHVSILPKSITVSRPEGVEWPRPPALGECHLAWAPGSSLPWSPHHLGTRSVT
eukprot:XP_023981926.1 salivary lipocalin-like isoform X1 [Physeter catodon]